MRYIFNLLLASLLTANLANAQDIDLLLVNKTVSPDGLTWSFDLQATALPSYTGASDNWSALNVRMDLFIPPGVSITGGSGMGLNGYGEPSGAGVTTTPPGSPPANWDEVGLSLNRANTSPSSEFPVGVPVIIASFSINFSASVLPIPATIVDIRETSASTGSFYVTFDDPTTRRPFILPAPAALPIKIAFFDADRYRDQNASDVRWTSVSEKNASHFELERSTDGRNFEYIANIKAEGGIDKVKEYQFIDDKLIFSRSTVNIFYYRLKMVDLDGKSDYSEVRSVRFDNTDKIDITYSPNPTANKVFVNMSTPVVDDVQNVSAVIFDINGKQIMSKSISTNGITEIDLSHLPAASYNFNVEYAGKVFTKTIIKTN
ncbi:MAG: T9SS type A sorting domain-containing protein [Saprospiraceae bacterium]|nr:T9SS type A sorting domain-containing protein [Saprospiraceae bacterium]MBK8849511.1 T9SS type A sorting domain-containing protein [Saprospiraceae bacterium]